MGATLLTDSVPQRVARRLQLLLTAFVFLQVRLPAAPPALPAAGLQSWAEAGRCREQGAASLRSRARKLLA